MSSEGGRHEIEAARKRLAAAKKLSSLAKATYDTAEKEVKDAQTMLAKAEKRWEVIDIDNEPDLSSVQNGGGNKKRKVSLSPQINNNENSNSRHNQSTSSTTAAAAAIPHNNSTSLSNINNGRGVGRFARSNNTISSNNNEYQIEVTGCGITELNGTYTQNIGVTHDNCPVYTRKGKWEVTCGMGSEGQAVEFALFRGGGCWTFGTWGDFGFAGPGYRLYSNLYLSASTPPEYGWMTAPGFGVDPVPKCRLVSNNSNSNSNPPNALQTNNTNSSNYINNGGGLDGFARTSRTNQTTSLSASASTSTSINVNQIEMKGCGIPELNGTYSRVTGNSSQLKLFTKKSQWEQARDVLGEKGEIVEFAVYQENGWKIGTIVGEGVLSSEVALNLGNTLFIHSNTVCGNPPGYGWTSVGFGVDPAPTCRLISNNNENSTSSERAIGAANTNEAPQQITITGCGIPEANGVYSKLSYLNNDRPQYVKVANEERYLLWYICVNEWLLSAKGDILYKCKFSVSIPPKKGWELDNGGVAPVPTLEY